MGEAETTEERPPEFDSILELTGLDPDQVAYCIGDTFIKITNSFEAIIQGHSVRTFSVRGL